MIDSSSSSAQLKDAISAVESLLGEADCNADIVRQLFPSHQAKREMKNKQLSGPDMAMARQRGVEVYNLCRSRFRSCQVLVSWSAVRHAMLRRGGSAERPSSSSTRPWRRRARECPHECPHGISSG